MVENNLNDSDNLPDQAEEEVNQNDSDDKEIYNDLSEGGWISWFCGLDGNEFFTEIDENFIRNTMNLYGLQKTKNFKHYIDTILSPESPSDTNLQSDE